MLSSRKISVNLNAQKLLLKSWWNWPGCIRDWDKLKMEYLFGFRLKKIFIMNQPSQKKMVKCFFSLLLPRWSLISWYIRYNGLAKLSFILWIRQISIVIVSVKEMKNYFNHHPIGQNQLSLFYCECFQPKNTLFSIVLWSVTFILTRIIKEHLVQRFIFLPFVRLYTPPERWFSYL